MPFQGNDHKNMESQKVVVVVEEADAARAALEWAVRNFIRGGDSITLLYVCPSTQSKKKQRNYRLKGFQLALSFKDMCNGIAEVTQKYFLLKFLLEFPT